MPSPATSTLPASRPSARPLTGLLLCLTGIAAVVAGRWAITPGLPVLAGIVAGYAGLVILLTSLADRLDTRPAGAYRDFGRYFLGPGMVAAALGIGLAVTQIRDATDLLIPRLAIPAVTVSAILIAVFAYLLARTGTPQPQPQAAMAAGPGKTGQPASVKQPAAAPGQTLKGFLALVLIAAAGYLLNQRFTEHREQQDRYAQIDQQERASAPPWTWHFDDFAPGTPSPDIQARLNRAGFRVYCPQRDLAANEKVLPGDHRNCWTLLKSAHGIPARVVSFGFNERGLTAQLIRFEPQEWAAVTSFLDNNGRRLEANFGRSGVNGPPVIGWRVDNGLVMSAESAPGEDITVLWMARDIFLREECAERQKAIAAGQRRAKVPVESWWPGVECGALAP